MKRIIITGATSGIGMAVAKQAAKDHKLLLLGRNVEVLEKLKTELVGEHKVMACDVTDVAQCNAAIAEAKSGFGGVDVLINNAGLGYFDPLVSGNLDQWHHMVDVNIKGVLNMFHGCLPHLLETKGHVVNIGSVASHHVFPDSGVYAATKHALFAISESIRVELMGKVRVTTISPGAVNTDFINKTTNEELHGKMKDYFATAMNPDSVALQIMNAITAPADSVVNEIILRPFR
ncbi:MAG: SDR family oxidoreductase [Bacteroidetes bacterium]|nr:SDR family oxidoreductase [Bacteroidota bacterium]